MSFAREERQNDLHVFVQLLNSTGIFYFWIYERDFSLLRTNCSIPLLEKLFDVSGCRNYVIQYAKKAFQPIILWSELGMYWLADFTPDEKGAGWKNTYIIGPLNSAESALTERENNLDALNISVEWKIRLKELQRSLPIISFVSLFQYAAMLHYCLTGQQIDRKDIRFQQAEADVTYTNADLPKSDMYTNWTLSQAVLDNIRNGNLNYQHDWKRMSQQGMGVRVDTGSTLDRGKISVISFTSLCAQAAVEGGLPPSEAYRKQRYYLQRVWECKTIGDAREINHQMYRDFVTSVHERRINPRLSLQVQACCDYIESHLEEKFTIQNLARYVGYHPYYLTRKFKAELGVNLPTYLRCARVERAKILLASSSLSIQEISEQLLFCSRAHFSETFKKITGVTPVQ